jgi:hypothetical protein
MENHNGVLMMQRVLLAGTLGMAMAQKAAAILEGSPRAQDARTSQDANDYAAARGNAAAHDYAAGQDDAGAQDYAGAQDGESALEATGFREPRSAEGAVLRAILDAANECLGHFDDRPAGERWCDTLFHLLDLAAFAAELSGRPG